MNTNVNTNTFTNINNIVIIAYSIHAVIGRVFSKTNKKYSNITFIQIKL